MVLDKFTVNANLPFYWRLAERNAPSPVGVVQLPFSFEPSQTNWLLQQHVSSELRSALQMVYRAEANIGYLQPGYDIARGYLIDLLGFLVPLLDLTDIDGPILEVGCGGCEVLGQLKDRGYSVFGVDPSPIAEFWGQEKNIKIFSENFDPTHFRREFRMAFCSDVLEHVELPVDFVSDIKKIVKDGGVVVVAVPDCTSGLRLGDVSFAMHQHLNYFTEASLGVCLRLAGLKDVSVSRSGYGGSIYGVGIVQDSFSPTGSGAESSDLTALKDFAVKERQSFLEIFKRKMNNVRENIEDALMRGENCAFYAPLRALPYLTSEGMQSYQSQIRFLDDTRHWHMKYFDGSPIQIENFSDLAHHMPSRIFVMSLTFERQICDRLESLDIASRNISRLSNLLAE